jgi:hypothetical protein
VREQRIQGSRPGSGGGRLGAARPVRTDSSPSFAASPEHAAVTAAAAGNARHRATGNAGSTAAARERARRVHGAGTPVVPHR